MWLQINSSFIPLILRALDSIPETQVSRYILSLVITQDGFADMNAPAFVLPALLPSLLPWHLFFSLTLIFSSYSFTFVITSFSNHAIHHLNYGLLHVLISLVFCSLHKTWPRETFQLQINPICLLCVCGGGGGGVVRVLHLAIQDSVPVILAECCIPLLCLQLTLT